MINSQLDALDDFLVANYQTYLDRITTDLTLSAPAEINQDEVDLDSYAREVELFIVPNDLDLEVQDLDGGRTGVLWVDAYLFLRKDTSGNLYTKVNFFAEALASLIFENPDLGGTIGMIDLEKIELYQAAEGKRGVKGFKAQVKIFNDF